ncbi:MAG: polysaccharide biosynthesis tyrosine autokinase, partial [Coriobacteriia bacterium]|nr:polysaccharide biosynthesis tyrosine autokinase [Coriobacteriia bacterium]
QDRNGQIIKNEQLGAQLSIATGLYSTLAEKLEALRIQEQLEQGSGRVVSTAVVEPDKVAPSPRRDALLGALVGLLLGLGLAFLLDYLDNTIKSIDQLEGLFGAPVLGQIPSSSVKKGASSPLGLLAAPGGAEAESYRALRNSIDFMNFEHNTKTVLVTSAAPSEGKSTVAANLSVALAQTGKRVALVCCDFRRPTTDVLLGVSNTVGISDVLTGRSALKDALQQTETKGLLVLTSGKMPPNPSELLGSKRMGQLIESLEGIVDWVILDTPPLLAVADAASLVRWTDGAVVVSRVGASTREAAVRSHEILSKVGARVMGVVVVNADAAGGGRGYGYGGYMSGYYYHGKGTQVSSTTDGLKEPIPGGRSRIAATVGKVLVGLLVFVIVLVVAAIIVTVLDGFLGWGLIDSLKLFGGA